MNKKTLRDIENMKKVIDSFEGKYRFLSNFYPWEIVDEDGVSWISTEHYYQAAKTSNPKERIEIMNAPFYAKDCAIGQKSVKSLGRSCSMRPDWDDVRLDVMEKALRMKFKSDNTMGLLLAKTGSADLIEGNHWGDIFFGMCGGKGENNLGKLLMKIRLEIQEKLEYCDEDMIDDLF